jgi:hypothetical protein
VGDGAAALQCAASGLVGEAERGVQYVREEVEVDSLIADRGDTGTGLPTLLPLCAAVASGVRSERAARTKHGKGITTGTGSMS